MCGIFGVAAFNKSVSEDCLRQGTNAMAHRGPDDSGVHLIRLPAAVPSNIGLGNRRLSIIDLSPNGHQPMEDTETGNWITYNGEIYNFREIRARLEQEGSKFSSLSDTEVILKAYGKWGKECLNELRGMFGFAIWDSHRQRLFLARDRLGIKPLYYFFENKQLYFSSEVRALLKSGLVPPRLNPVGLSNYLTFGSVYDPETLIKGINALRAGHYLIWENGQIKEEEYWDISTHQAQLWSNSSIVDEKDEKKILVDLRETLEEAVRLRLVSDVPVGVFLSGGIDSSTIVGLLNKNASSKVSTFSIVFKELDYSESYFSRIIAKHFNTDHHEVSLSQQDAMEAIPDAICAMDQPTVDGINTYIVSREARRSGLKVALSGLGGDEMFAGYSNFKTIPKMERFTSSWKYIPSTLRSLAARTYGHLVPENDRNLKLTTFIQGNSHMAHPYVLSRMLFTPDQQKRLLAVYDSTIFENANKPLSDTLHRTEGFDSINRVSYLELRNYMLNTLLRDTDFMSMAHGLEVRVPLIDHKLVEFLFTLPGDLKINAQVPKYLLTKATEGLLPDEVVHRPKRGFTLPFEHWLKDELRSEVEKILLDTDDGLLEEFVNPDRIQAVWQAFLNGSTSWSRPWALYILKKWVAINLS